jgi:hypothetical protein
MRASLSYRLGGLSILWQERGRVEGWALGKVAWKEDGGGIGGKMVGVGQLCRSLALILDISMFALFQCFLTFQHLSSKKIMEKMWGKAHLYTIGGNVN